MLRKISIQVELGFHQAVTSATTTQPKTRNLRPAETNGLLPIGKQPTTLRRGAKRHNAAAGAFNKLESRAKSRERKARGGLSK